jgi:ubiquinone/menaquinone biosynthesis C-methylase UbiE
VPLFDRLHAAAYDRVLAGAERAGLSQRRRELLGDLHGHVVELGAGTGANLAAYGPAVTRLTLLEPSPAMADRLRARVASTPLAAEVEVVAAPGEALPLGDDQADAVVSTLVLCTVADLDRTLAEVERVLRPDGRLVLLEHVVADDPSTRRLQRLLHRPWQVVGAGCQLDRDPRSALARRGWDVSDLLDERLPMPAPTRSGQVGTATR